jgi:hypothetical protein
VSARRRLTPATRGAVACVALAGVGFAVAGCGQGAPPLDLGRLSSQLVTQRDIGAALPGSPERRLLTWWRDVQFMNLSGYLGGFAPAARRGVAQDERAVSEFVQLAQSVRGSLPHVVSDRRRGRGAILLVEVRSRDLLRGYRYRTIVSSPQRLDFVHLARGWRLANDRFVRGWLGIG